MVVEEQDISLDDRVSRLEGVAEQINLRLESLDRNLNARMNSIETRMNIQIGLTFGVWAP
ncbi:MAG: hypothetical protein OXC95_00740 [Dehalococcoidia bacterium]|nr:hypothetical protein [Dehalococcoidia bacterium]